MFVDTHAHLNSKSFDEDREEVLAEALETLPFLVNVGYDPENSRQAVAFAQAHDRVYATCGIHPHEAEKYGPEAAQSLIEELASRDSVVALGEMGLDFHYEFSPREIQKEVFRVQLNAAKERELPVVVHIRDAEPEALELWSEAGWTPGIWHCCTGQRENVLEAASHGIYISFSGILTFKRSEDLRQLVQDLPREQVLVETDSPYLAPIPYRGKRNRPRYVEEVGKLVAELWDLSVSETAAILTENSRRVFQLS